MDVKTIVRVGSWTGRPKIPGVTEQHGVRCPKDAAWEDPDDGCPAGWRLSGYGLSLIPYLRRRLEDGARVPNPLHDRLSDDAMFQALNYYEHEQERCIAHTRLIEEQARRG